MRGTYSQQFIPYLINRLRYSHFALSMEYISANKVTHLAVTAVCPMFY